jgi:hypothetical protein
MIPISDDNPTTADADRHLDIIALCVGCSLGTLVRRQHNSKALIRSLGFSRRAIFFVKRRRQRRMADDLTSMFPAWRADASPAATMLYLWIFGNNVEDAMRARPILRDLLSRVRYGWPRAWASECGARHDNTDGRLHRVAISGVLGGLMC